MTKFRHPKNIRFECQRCARCCGDTSHRGRNILLREEELKRISEATGRRPLSFASRVSSVNSYPYRMKKRNGKCIFLDGKACKIYKIKPIICSFYPFSLRKTSEGYIFEVSKECPGIGLGDHLDQEYFGEMLELAFQAHSTKI